MYEFRYMRAGSVAEAVEAVINDPDAVFLSGGQSLLPMLKSRLAAPSLVVDLRHLETLKGIELSGDIIRIGAGTCHAEVGDSPLIRRHVPALADLAGSIADMHVRNLGTLGGSIALNDPAADYPAALLALDAVVHTDRRDIPAEAFLTGLMSTALEPGELVVAATFRIPLSAAYRKVRNPVSGFPMAGAMAARFAEGYRIGITGVSAGGAFRWTEAERLAETGGNPSDLQHIALENIDILSDMQAGEDYRRHLLRLVTHDALAAIT